MLICFVDGGAKPNPGRMYGSFKIYRNGESTIHNEKLTFVEYEYGTNNMSEYLALIELLKYLHKNNTKDAITINMDSRLVVKQLSGDFKVNHERLKILWKETKSLLEGLDIKIKHISGKRMKRILGH